MRLNRFLHLVQSATSFTSDVIDKCSFDVHPFEFLVGDYINFLATSEFAVAVLVLFGVAVASHITHDSRSIRVLANSL